MAAKLTRVSQREYAKRLNVSNTAVQKAIQEKKIVKGYDRQTKQIIVEYANQEWGLLHMQTDVGKIIAPDDQPNPKKNVLNEDTSFVEARRLQAIMTAQLTALDLRERKGELVQKKEVYLQLAGFGQQMRMSLQVIPDRVIDNILACKSRQEAHAILTNAIHESLHALTNPKDFDFKPR